MKVILNRLEQWEIDPKKIFLIVLICLLVIYVDFAFLVKSQLKWLKDTGLKVAQLRTDIDKLKNDLANLKEKETTKMRLAHSAQKIISEEQIPLLLQQISDIANQHNVKVLKMVPDKTKDIILITLNLISNYHQFGAFLNALENADIFMQAEEIKIKRHPQDYFQQDFFLLLKTYVKK